MDAHPDRFTQADWDALCEPYLTTEPRQIKPEFWLRVLDDLTSDRVVRSGGASNTDEPARSCPDELHSEETSATSAASQPSSRTDVSQQLCGGGLRYGFESARRTYFDHCSDPLFKNNVSLSRYPKRLNCEFNSDYKCKDGPFAVISTARSVPLHGLCGRCGTVGDHLMILCLGCCDSYHAFCAHVPEKLVPRLTSWYCHRCAQCSLCGGAEYSGKQFTNDVIETCFRCHRQFHLYCNNNTNFCVLFRNSTNEFKVCNGCFTNAACQVCHQFVYNADLCRDFCSGTKEVCVVCRNRRERDYCKNCCDIPDLRKSVCSYCGDTYHTTCGPPGQHIAKAFVCFNCMSSRQISPHVLWTRIHGQSVVDKVIKYVMLLMNWELSCRNDDSPLLTSQGDRNMQKRALGEVNSEEDLGISLPSDAEEEPNRFDMQDETRAIIKLFVSNRFSANPMDEFFDQPSPDSGIPRSSSGASSPDGSFVRELNFAFPDSFAALCEKGSVRQLSVCIGSGLYGRPHASDVKPVALTDQSEPSVQRGKHQNTELCIYSRLVRDLVILRNDRDACGNANAFVRRLTEIAALPSISMESRCALQEYCSELTQWMPSTLNCNANLQKPLPEWLSITPLSRIYDRTSSSMISPVLGDRTVVDCRVCHFCCVAGDDQKGAGGRLISMGFDLWAHVGCLSFFATRHLFWDYAIFKLESLDTGRFWRRECASCPLRFGMIGCLHPKCPNSYHLNCAIEEQCIVLPSEGVLCPLHKTSTSHLLLRNGSFPSRKDNDLPIYCRTSWSDVHMLSSTDWSAMPKGEVCVYFGGTVVRSLGRLVRGWDLSESVIPCGYSGRKWYWSTVNPMGITQYRFFIVDIESSDELKARLCSILEVTRLPAWIPSEEPNDDPEVPAKPEETLPNENVTEARVLPECKPEELPECKAEEQRTTVMETDTAAAAVPCDVGVPSVSPEAKPVDGASVVIPEISLVSDGGPIADVDSTHERRSLSPEISLRPSWDVSSMKGILPFVAPPEEQPRLSPTTDSDVSSAKWRPLPPISTIIPKKNYEVERLGSDLSKMNQSLLVFHYAHLSTSSDVLRHRASMRRSRNVQQENVRIQVKDDVNKNGFTRKPIQLPRSREFPAADVTALPAADPQKNSSLINGMRGLGNSCSGKPVPRGVNQWDTALVSPNMPKKRSFADSCESPSNSLPVAGNGLCIKKQRAVIIKHPKSANAVKAGDATQPGCGTKSLISLNPKSNAPKIRSVLMTEGGVKPTKVKKQVHFAATHEERVVESSGFGGPYDGTCYPSDPALCLMPPVEDPDPNHYLFGTAKTRAREEVCRSRQKQIRELRDYLEHRDNSKISKVPSRLSILMGDDGYFAVSPSPIDLIQHLYSRLQNARNSRGLRYEHRTAAATAPSSLEFLGLTHPTVQFLLEQLPPPHNAPSPYRRKYFAREQVKTRSRGDIVMPFITPEPPLATCPTCPLPASCFVVTSGRTFLKTNVQCRQVLFRWSMPYGQKDVAKLDKLVRVASGVYVEKEKFPGFCAGIRQTSRPTAVLIYVVHPLNPVVTLAFISTKNLSVASEIRYNPDRSSRTIESRLYLSDFRCVKHNRKD
ncbi:uncharacterized protein LOC129602596 [Paramacrobiotus metropolitanus]|uniref:uncharacterized protein LOC129602596 n=1 Tax=Paramacrobiotus metropolitanus TaxID=2943436 RepID=UPI0024461B65|nr:uncharacterized protein LOC129602596 [Paramacrobiotus metropolitanus]XP_055357634.1 uncharacterized protein LOC129602596 [Paramacrobiotus metropolitanus]